MDSSAHAKGVQLAGDVLRGAFDRGFAVHSQLALTLGVGSAPKPDVAVVSGPARDDREGRILFQDDSTSPLGRPQSAVAVADLLP
jgi:hypothetical protein